MLSCASASGQHQVLLFALCHWWGLAHEAADSAMACSPLEDGWVLLAVDVNLAHPEQPEALLGYRRAVHPFQFDEALEPVVGFCLVISEMMEVIERGAGIAAQSHSASRARAFEVRLHKLPTRREGQL